MSRCRQGIARCCAVSLLLALGWTSTLALTSAQTPTEYQLKAAFLYNFAQFVEWPASAFANDNAPLVIGVLGADPFGPELDAIVRGETVNRRPLIVRRLHDIAQADGCHILFISDSEDPRLGPVLGALKGRAILTVGDSEEFSRQGGMIRFVMERNRIHLRIRLSPVDTANLSISSKLLRLADVEPAGGT